jgi:hypothetical protein
LTKIFEGAIIEKKEVKKMKYWVYVVGIAVIVSIAALISAATMPREQETTVIGRVFFDNPEYGIPGALDVSDIASGGVKVVVGKWHFENENNIWFECVAEGSVNENGWYKIAVPRGQYTIAVDWNPLIARIYNSAYFLPSDSFEIAKGQEIAAGPVVFFTKSAFGGKG